MSLFHTINKHKLVEQNTVELFKRWGLTPNVNLDIPETTVATLEEVKDEVEVALDERIPDLPRETQLDAVRIYLHTLRPITVYLTEEGVVAELTLLAGVLRPNAYLLRYSTETAYDVFRNGSTIFLVDDVRMSVTEVTLLHLGDRPVFMQCVVEKE